MSCIKITVLTTEEFSSQLCFAQKLCQHHQCCSPVVLCGSAFQSSRKEGQQHCQQVLCDTRRSCEDLTEEYGIKGQICLAYEALHPKALCRSAYLSYNSLHGWHGGCVTQGRDE